MISLIATIYNEVDTIVSWLESMQAQTSQPDEIIIVDGGSTDGTWELLREKSEHNQLLKVFQEKGNIAHGRNTAIRHARGEFIVVADAGCKYRAQWFEKITHPLMKEGTLFVTTAFGPWLKKEDTLKVYLIAVATIPALQEFHYPWLASSRSVAFAKKVWENVQGYPEWLPICEDIEFDLSVEKQGVQSVYVRESLVLWRPRLSLRKYCLQLFKYTRGDGHAQLFFIRQVTRYIAYVLGIALVVMASQNYWFLILLGSGVLAYTYKFYKRWLIFSKDKSIHFRIVGLFMVPFVIMLGDGAKMCGWPIGVYERISGNVNRKVKA